LSRLTLWTHWVKSNFISFNVRSLSRLSFRTIRIVFCPFNVHENLFQTILQRLISYERGGRGGEMCTFTHARLSCFSWCFHKRYLTKGLKSYGLVHNLFIRHGARRSRTARTRWRVRVRPFWISYTFPVTTCTRVNVLLRLSTARARPTLNLTDMRRKIEQRQ